MWRENAVLLAEVQFMEQQAQNHFQHFLQLKVVKQSHDVTLKTATINFSVSLLTAFFSY